MKAPTAMRETVLELIDHLIVENKCLKRGDLTRALALSEQRVGLVDTLESMTAERNGAQPEELRPETERLARLNRENAALLAAAISGRAEAQALLLQRAGGAGYSADGRRLFPESEKTSRRF